jgi:hypothetical protein
MLPDVLIYVQSVKDFFSKNKETRDYFIGGSDEDEFFNFLSEISSKNYEEKNEPQLTKEQFELLRGMIQVEKLKNLAEEKDNLFFDVTGFGKFCLN